MPKGKNKFTKEQIQQLSASKNVRQISETTISFHEEFSRRYYSERINGMRPKDIFRENGIDPEILGKSRIRSYDVHTRRKAERETGFSDERKLNQRRSKNTPQTDADRITQLEHELAYTRQEVEFLKKIASANMEARIAWESKQRQK